MSSWTKEIQAITLFVEDLEDAKSFYSEIFELPIVYSDASSAVFRFDKTMINLLDISSAPGLIGPATVATRGSGSRLQLTLEVDDVDARCAWLTARGVTLVNGPLDRPWGIRTACFADPGGHLWEIAQAIPQSGQAQSGQAQSGQAG